MGTRPGVKVSPGGMRIGELAGLVGISTRAIRHYPDLIINLAELPEPQHGRETWRQGFEMMRHAFPGLQAHIEDIVAARDKVAVRVRFRGTHTGEFLGFAATGRTVEYVSHEFYRIAGGLIAEEWICSDMATLFRQLS
jgi:predicted ester cyclase